MWKDETDRLIARLQANPEFRPSSDPDAWDAEIGELDRLGAAVGSGTVAGVTVSFEDAESSNLCFETDFEDFLWMVGGPGWDGLYVEAGAGPCRVWQVEGGLRRPLRMALVAHSVVELLHQALDRAEHGWETGHLADEATLVTAAGLDVSALTDLPVTFAAEGDTPWGRGLSWLPPRLFPGGRGGAPGWAYGAPETSSHDDAPQTAYRASETSPQDSPPHNAFGASETSPQDDVQIGPFQIIGKWLTRGDEVVELTGYSRLSPVGSFTGGAGMAAMVLEWLGWKPSKSARALRLEGDAGQYDLALPDELSEADTKALTAVLIGVLQFGFPAPMALAMFHRAPAGE
jgi:hypothetical protein